MRTFINAFESSPVHCLKPRPSGNLRRPANGGAAAILKKDYENLYNKCEIDHTAGQYHPRLLCLARQGLFGLCTLLSSQRGGL